MSNIKHGNGATLLFFKVLSLAYRCMYDGAQELHYNCVQAKKLHTPTKEGFGNFVGMGSGGQRQIPQGRG